MTVFKHYLKIAKKLIPAFMIYTFIFLFFALFATSENETMFSSQKPKIAIINNDQSSLSAKFEEYCLIHMEIVKISENEVSDALFYREVDLVVTIPNNFVSELANQEEVNIQVRQIPDSTTSIYAQMLINQYWNTVDVYLQSNISVEQINEIILTDLAINTKVTMLVSDQASLAKVKTFFSFANYTYLATSILLIGLVTSIFNKENLKKRNLVSPLAYKKISFQLFLGNAIFVLAMWTFYAVISILVYPSVMLSNIGCLYLLNSFVFCILCLTAGILIGNLVKNKAAQNGIVNVVALGTSFLCGAFVPQEYLGNFVLTIAKVLPSYWYIKNNDEIALLTKFSFWDLKYVLLNMLIVLLFSLAIYLIILYINSRKKVLATK